MARPFVRPLAEAAAGAAVFAVTHTVLAGAGTGVSVPRQAKALMVLAALALLVVRRRRPALSLLGTGALLGALSSLGMLMAVIAYTTARQLPGARRRAALLLSASAVTVCSAALSAPYEGLGSLRYGLTIGAVVAGLTVLVPGLAGASAGQQDRLVAALRERSETAEEASRIQERTRIAAEMHDLVGHRLSLISLHTGGLEMALRGQPRDLRESAAQVRQTTRDAMRELREVLGVLGPLSRDTGTDALTDATGTRADIEALVAESRAGGVAVTLHWSGPDTDVREARVRRAVHRVVREGLTNVHRYAAGAPVSVVVTHTGELAVVRITNGPRAEGHPAAPPGTGRGLTALRERVALLGGTLEAAPRSDGGYTLTARIPATPTDPAGPSAGPNRPATGGGGPSDPAGPAGPPGPGAGSPVPVPAPPDPADPGVPRSGAALLRRLGQGATALLGMAGVGAMLILGLRLADDLRLSHDYAPPEPPRLGMSRSAAERAGAVDHELSRAAAAGREPPRPAGTTDCVYPYSYGTSGPHSIELTRYCFSGDVLTGIDRFDVPLAPGGETRSTP
ncbi:sensor histidine kinase [Streptomyces sp. NPDC101132]|uniref:sensor histidine kinase n=1 Tax=Streptomyces sp. NPDC101132 TaxID=3366110 RepID=UPI003803E0E0